MISKDVFSSNLRSLMDRDHLSQVDLAQKLGVTKAAVNYWYNGRSIPQVTVVQRLAAIFSCSTDELLKPHEEPLLSGSPEERLLSIFRGLSEDGKVYLLQQASIASVMFEKKDDNISSSKIG